MLDIMRNLRFRTMILLVFTLSYGVFLGVIGLNFNAIGAVRDMNRQLRNGPLKGQIFWQNVVIGVRQSEELRRQFMLDRQEETVQQMVQSIANVREILGERIRQGDAEAERLGVAIEDYQVDFEALVKTEQSLGKSKVSLTKKKEAIETVIYEADNKGLESALGEFIIAEITFLADTRSAAKIKAVQVLLDRLDRDGSSIKGEKERNTLLQGVKNYREEFTALIGFDSQMVASSNNLQHHAELMVQDVNGIKDRAGQEAEAASESADQKAQDARTYALLWTTCGVLASTLMAFGFYNRVSSQLGCDPLVLARMVRHVAEGDLVAAENNRTCVGERGVLGDLRRMSRHLRQTIADILAIANHVDDGSKELTTTARLLTDGAIAQASAIEQTAASMEEMNNLVRFNGDSARQTEKIANNAAKSAQESGETVARAVSAMRDIAGRVSIIQEIARMTNLLALNAAIEAARAGEHGRGFAVVSSEVRKLAQRSQSAAGEINTLSASSLQVAEEAGTMIQNLLPSIQETADLVRKIAEAGENQGAHAGQIDQSIKRLVGVIQENRDSAEKIANTADILARRSTQLPEELSFFKV